MGVKLSTNTFIEKANKVHNNLYDYSLVDYFHSKTRVKIICPEHGIFEQLPAKHLMGQGCPKCTHNSKKNFNQYIVEFNRIHSNKYQYTSTSFENAHSKIEIICPIHGPFFQTINSHKNGNGCLKCYNHSKKSTEEFIFNARKVHGDKYDYSNVEYTRNNTKIKITCPVHGEFYQSPRVHLSGCGCPTCNQSKGEKLIHDLLLKRQINFIPQHKFKDCKHINLLPFDFYLPDYNICIEYHGEQHFKPVKHFGGEKYFRVIKKRDKIKEEYCLNNNIQLIIVSSKI